MSDTPGEVRIRIEAAGDRPPVAAAGATSSGASGAVVAERRRPLVAQSGASAATNAPESDSRSRPVGGIRATPT